MPSPNDVLKPSCGPGDHEIASGYRIVGQRESLLFLDGAAYRSRPEKRCFPLAGVVPEPVGPRRYETAELKRRVFEQLGHPIQEAGVGLLGDLEGASTAPLEFTEQPIHVAHLVFHGVEPRQPHPRVRTRHRQKVREVRHRNAFVGLESRFAPPLSEVAALTSDPVARTRVSTNRLLPSLATMPSGSIRSMPLVSRCT